MNGVSMTTTRRLRPHRPHRGIAVPLALPAALATIALVAVVMVSPDAARVQAADVFESLRAPGETGFVAGHRGDLASAPENTLPALALALASDAEFVETDLQLTSDGVAVLMHDWTVDRTTDGSGPVWGMTWDELSQLDAGSWYGEAFVGTRVPTLTQLLDLVRQSSKRALVELKGSWTAEQLEGVADEVHRFGLDNRVAFASFDIMSLRALQVVAPELQRLVISRDVVGDPAILAGTCGAVAIITSRGFLRDEPEAVARIHDAGLGVLVYTLNDADTWSAAVSLGVDGIITDQPALFGEWLAKSVEQAPAASAALETRRG